jgi:GNAT superfamily N-acetyltransferase
MLEILPLTDDYAVMATIAKWNCDFWGVAQDPQDSIKFYQECLTSEIPFTLLAYFNGELAGCVSLERRGDLYLGCSLYVEESFRGQGVGAALVVALKNKADRLGITDVYTWTADLSSWYQGLGFKVINKDVEHQGLLVDVLVSTTHKGE